VVNESVQIEFQDRTLSALLVRAAMHAGEDDWKKIMRAMEQVK